MFNELKRAAADILIAVVDGLKGLTEAISAAYPRTTVQTCIVHLIRNSLEYASYKDRKAAAALRPIYAAASEEAAKQALQDFADGPWGENTQPSCNRGRGMGARRRSTCSRRRFDGSYTTNAIES